MAIRWMAVAAVVVAATGCASLPSGDWFPAPDVSGPKTARVGEKVKFTVEGTDPLDVHEYQWNFGDGSELTDWNDSEEVKHIYLVAGRFEVRARERCPLQLFQSDWSEPHKITVSAASASVQCAHRAGFLRRLVRTLVNK